MENPKSCQQAMSKCHKSHTVCIMAIDYFQYSNRESERERFVHFLWPPHLPFHPSDCVPCFDILSTCVFFSVHVRQDFMIVSSDSRSRRILFIFLICCPNVCAPIFLLYINVEAYRKRYSFFWCCVLLNYFLTLRMRFFLRGISDDAVVTFPF